MKSLQESLFDKDLVEKGVPVNFETLRGMLFEFGRKRIKLFDKAGVIYHEGSQSIFLKKFLDDSNRDESVCFELVFGVTNLFNEGTGFNVPILKAHDRWGAIVYSHNRPNEWKLSSTGGNITMRVICKKVELEDNYHSITAIEATDENVGKVFDLYDGMIKEFCSTEFEKKLKKYISHYEGKKEIPGLILDILMKELINKA